jgi:FAD/FMN-containing dehydrogenase
MALPASAEEAAAVISRCRAHGVAVVPQGGNTSLVGGATPMQPNSVLLASDKLNRVRQIDPIGYTATVEAGCILDDIRAAAEREQRLFPLWLGASGSARLGGLIGTNAGGLQVQRYGNTRELVLGIEAVLPDGQIFHGLRPLRKRNAGYDLKQLFIGAEGTLGFVTAATLRLFPHERGQATAMVALRHVEEVLRLFTQAKEGVGEVLTAFEMIDHHAMTLMARHYAVVPQPFADIPPCSVLISLSGSEPDAVLNERLANLLLEAGCDDAALAQDGKQAKALWRLRELIPSAQTKEGPSIKHDLALPISAIPTFMAESTALLARHLPAARPVVFGHIGDGNLHYNLSLPASEDFAASEAIANRLLFGLVTQHGGDISAEHGIGRLRLAEADARHDPVERELMRRIKHEIDPDGFFNPGVLIDRPSGA